MAYTVAESTGSTAVVHVNPVVLGCTVIAIAIVAKASAATSRAARDVPVTQARIAMQASAVAQIIFARRLA